MRKFGILMLSVLGCGGSNQQQVSTSTRPVQQAQSAAPVAKSTQEWNAVEMNAGWGSFIDPDGDCKQTWNGGTLTIAVPGKTHELQGDGKRNAPRLLVDRNGDFAMNVRAAGKLAPQPSAAGSKFAPYHGAGIFVWESDASFIRCERAKILGPNGQSLTYINFEAQGPGGGSPIKQQPLQPDEAVHLRIERRGNKIVGLMSKDGTSWTMLGETFLSSSGPLKVGVAAVNSSDAPFAPEFSDFKFFEMKKP